MSKRTKKAITYFILTGIVVFTTIPLIAVVYRGITQ